MRLDPDDEPVQTFELLGGRTCLDFANTVSEAASEEASDKLHSYDHLLIFARRAGILDEAAARALAEEATRRPDEAREVLDEARRLRRAIFALFYPLPDRAHDALAVLDRELARARRHQHLVARDEGYAAILDGDVRALDRPLWVIALSAADLLVSPAREHVHGCGDTDGCTWLFIDESKNHSRRWCSMKDCGNRVKARRHYQKRTQRPT